MRPAFLTNAEIEHFYARGYVVVSDCFPRYKAARRVQKAFTFLNYNPDDPATWEKPSVFLPNRNWDRMEKFAPRAFAAACDLLGGAERISTPVWMGDGFNANFRLGADKPWQPPAHTPPPGTPGWHKDGDFFRNFLDNGEQGLVALVFWTDVGPQGGGTYLACDSIAPVARHLAAHPEGVVMTEFHFGGLISECHDFVALEARVGDVVLCHPLMLHSSSQNMSGRPRFLTNPPIQLSAPLQFTRPAPDDFSPVERSILNALDVERLDYQITGVRERVVTRREQVQAAMLQANKARLKAEKAAVKA